MLVLTWNPEHRTANYHLVHELEVAPSANEELENTSHCSVADCSADSGFDLFDRDLQISTLCIDDHYSFRSVNLVFPVPRCFTVEHNIGCCPHASQVWVAPPINVGFAPIWRISTVNASCQLRDNPKLLNMFDPAWWSFWLAFTGPNRPCIPWESKAVG